MRMNRLCVLGSIAANARLVGARRGSTGCEYADATDERVAP
jgi:hypothetical protein